MKTYVTDAPILWEYKIKLFEKRLEIEYRKRYFKNKRGFWAFKEKWSLSQKSNHI